MISRLMMEDALQFSAIMNCRRQWSWMPRPSCFIHSCFSFSSVIFHPRSFWGSLAHYISSLKVGSFIRLPLICTHSCLVRHISSPLFFGSCPSYFFHVFFLVLARLMSSTFSGVLLSVIFHPRKFVHSSVRRSLHAFMSRTSYFIHESLFIHLSAAHRRSWHAFCVYAFVCVSRVALSAMAGVVGVSVCFLRVLLPRRSC